jgi:DNA repair protein RadC
MNWLLSIPVVMELLQSMIKKHNPSGASTTDKTLTDTKLCKMIALTDNVAEIQISYQPTSRLGPVISSSQDAYEELLKWFPEETIHLQEHFVVLYLNRANRVLGAYLASTGGMTGTVADPRLIMSVALKTAAVSVVLGHNHPSGSLKPSRSDEVLTRKLHEAGLVLDINILDHIIVTTGGFFSFTDNSMI